ncbi:MAG: response regulator transcription factor [Opitutaceae bacterium]
MNPTRLFMVDDHPFVREWLGNLLRLQTDLCVIGEAGDPVSALAAMIGQPPDVAVVDLTFKRGSGLDLIKDLRSQLPQVKVVVHSMHEELTDVERAFRAGASAYVMKRESTAQIITAIREVRAGRIFASPEILPLLTARLINRPAANASPSDVLSDRELEVFRRLGRGHATREIADDLGVSLKTVQTYCARIKEKLGLDDGQELARTAFEWSDQVGGSSPGSRL